MTLRPYAVSGALIQAAWLLAACGQAPDNDAATRNDAPVAQSSPSPAVVSGPKRTVLAFGDSLYAGYGLDRGQSLPDVLQERLRASGIDGELINAGVSGDTTAGGKMRLAYTLDQLGTAPDLVLLGLGGNDVLRQISPDETRANLEAMLDELDRRGIPVILTGMLAPPNLGPDYAKQFNEIFRDLSRKHDAALDPFILEGVIGNRDLMLPDGVHPNAQGVARIADRLAPLIKGELQKLPPR